MRQTSIDAYYEMERRGALKGLRLEVVRVLAFADEPMTAGEVAVKIPQTLGHSVTPRFAELKRMGVIIEAGARPCSVTSINSLTWQLTGRVLEGKKKNEQILLAIPEEED
jgi:hypothetical protein